MKLIGIGAGEHAQVLIDALEESGHTMEFLLDPEEAKWGQKIFNCEIIGGDDLLAKYSATEYQLVNCIGSVGIPTIRQKIFRNCKEKGFKFFTVTHPSAVVSKYATLGEGVQVMARAVIMASAQIGDDTIINTSTSIDHDCKIGSHCHIAPGVVMSGGTVIGDLCHVGTQATFSQRPTVGDKVVIGAASLVNKSLPGNCKAFGVPAKVIEEGSR